MDWLVDQLCKINWYETSSSHLSLHSFGPRGAGSPWASGGPKKSSTKFIWNLSFWEVSVSHWAFCGSFKTACSLPPWLWHHTTDPQRREVCWECWQVQLYLLQSFKGSTLRCFSLVKQSWQCMTVRDECPLSGRHCWWGWEVCLTLTGVVAECLNAPNKENRSAFNFMDCTVKIYIVLCGAAEINFE